ncbi:MAG: tetratricopeptide repeat protein [Pyrinomonadaceae bacterium]
MLKNVLNVIVIAICVISGAVAQSPVITGVTAASTDADTIVVIPFTNKASTSESNWIGESFAESLSDLLSNKGINVLSNQERKFVQQELGIPNVSVPSIATSVKVGIHAKASLVVIGDYQLLPETDGRAPSVVVNARIIKVKGGIVSEDFPDQRKLGFNFSDALGNLQKIQGQLAWEILYRIDKSYYKVHKDGFPWAVNDLIRDAESKVPPRASEAFVKAISVSSSNPAAKENYLKNAIRIYADAKTGETYSDAALELGHLYLSQRKSNDAAAAFEQVINSYQQCRERAKSDGKPGRCDEDGYAEAAFYDGLIQLQLNNLEKAMAVLKPLADDLKLTSVNNVLGAISIQAARAEKKNASKSAAMVNDAVELLKRANESAPDDADIRFNYATALFISGNMLSAAAQLRSSIAGNPRDGDAYFMLAKALQELNDPQAVLIDNEARNYLQFNNRYATLQTEWDKSKTVNGIPMRVAQPQRKDFLSVILTRKRGAAAPLPKIDDTQALIAKARGFYKNGQDDEAMEVLRRVLASEPANAETFLLLGKIYLRRGDIEQAISSFKTSVFWDNRLIDAHVSLGKIYIEKSDCLQAKNYAVSAIGIDSENQDAIALQRLSERCSK